MQNPQISDALINSFVFGIYIYQGDEGKIVFANKHLADMLGYEKDELLGRSLFDIYTNNKNELQKYVKGRIRKESSLGEHLNFSLMSKTGAAIYAEEFDYSIDYKGKPSGLVILTDKTKEESFRKLFYALSQINQLVVRTDNEEELFSQICVLLVDAVGYYAVGIGSIDENTKLFKLNYLKSKSGELENTSRNITVSADPNTSYGRGSVSKAYETGKVSFVVDVLNDAAMDYWHDYYEHFNIYSACSIPIFKQGKIKYILLINDNTKGSLSQDHLHLLEEIQLDISFAVDRIEKQRNILTFSKAVDIAHEWVVITDRGGNIISANKAVSDISGYAADELIGQNPKIFKSGYHDKEFYKKLWQKIVNGKQYSERFINKTKSGSLFYLDTIIIPIVINGKVERFVDLSRDVTEMVKQQKYMEIRSKIYSTLYRINTLFLESKNKEEFLKNLTNIFTIYLGIDAAFIGEIKGGLLNILYRSVKDDSKEGFLKSVQEILNNPQKTLIESETPFIKAYKHKRIYLVNDLLKYAPQVFKSDLKAYNINSCCALPIIQGDKSIYGLALISGQKDLFNASVYHLLNVVSKAIEFILNKFEQDRFAQMILAAVNTGLDCLIITDERFNVVYVNDRTLEMTGCAEEEILGHNLLKLSVFIHDKTLEKMFCETLAKGSIFSERVACKTKDGRLIQLDNITVPFKIYGKIKNYITLSKDMTKERSLIKQINKLSAYDSLTGLYNRTSFKKAVAYFIRGASQKNEIGAAAAINPISFGSINQAFGFENGNEILKHISQRLKMFLRDYDVIAKLESDRFGVLIKDLKREEDMFAVVTKLLSELRKPYKVGNSKVSISFNMGLSMYPKDGKNAKQLLDKANAALLDAKAKGENSVGFFNKDLEEKTMHNLKLKTDLESALKNREFILYYQPYVDGNLNIVGAESLLRWRKDDEIIPPMEFIPYLEETDLIISVEDCVFDLVMEELKKLQSQSIKPVPISVNFSYKSINQSHLAQQIASKLAGSNLPKNLIGIEIIERSFMENLNNTKNLMEELKTKGIYFSIDDFGTGYSSLSYLAQLPADYIKIDISFVRKITADKHTQSIVRSVIFLAKELSMKIIAEGVEIKEQFEMLKDMGCDYFQGYLFYKPMPEEQFEKVLEKERMKVLLNSK